MLRLDGPNRLRSTPVTGAQFGRDGVCTISPETVAAIKQVLSTGTFTVPTTGTILDVHDFSTAALEAVLFSDTIAITCTEDRTLREALSFRHATGTR